MGIKDLYLIFYNAACCAGWAYVLYLAGLSVYEQLQRQEQPEEGSSTTTITALKDALATAHQACGDVLFYAQGAALLEIVHAMIKFVRSPVMVTAMQVMSRIVALVAVTYSVPAQSKFGQSS